MEGIRTACLYSYGCNKTFILGVDSDISDFIIDPKERKVSCIVRILKKLEPYSAYCSLAALSSPFEEDAVRAYWLGGAHNFEVLKKAMAMAEYVSSGAGLLSCLVSSGEIIGREEDKIKVVHHRLVQQGRKLSFQHLVEQVDSGFVLEPRIGDFISIHLGKAREVISCQTADTLIEITEKRLREA